MKFIGRKTLKSERARMHRIDVFFLRVGHAFILLYGIFLFFAWFSQGALFAINAVAVEGTYATSAVDIQTIATSPLKKKFLFLINKNNKLLYERNAVRDAIVKSDPRIARVSIMFPTRHRIVVHVEEYTPSFLYCFDVGKEEISSTTPDSAHSFATSSASSSAIVVSPVVVPSASSYEAPVLSDCYFADQNGYVFVRAPLYSGYPFLAIIASTSTAPSSSLPSPIGTYVLAPLEHQQMLTFISALLGLSFRTHAIILHGDHDVELDTNMPWNILWTMGSDPRESALNLKVVLDSFNRDQSKTTDIHVVDLRFGNKIFYK